MKRLLLALLAPLALGAQQPGQLQRTSGVADSTLFVCSDSTKANTKACKFSLIQARLSFRAWDSLVTANLRLTNAVNGSATWASTQTFAAAQRVDSATGAARASALVGSPAITVSSCTGCTPAVVDSATGAVRAQTLTTSRTLWGQSFNGSANITAAPTFGAGATVSNGQTLTLTGATLTGLTAASVGSGTFPSGTYSFTGATALTGGAGNTTLTCGTGNSRTCTFQSTTSAGTAKNVLVLGADSSTTTLGKILAGDSLVLLGTSASIVGGSAGLDIRASRASSATKSVNIYATGSSFQQSMLTIGPSAATDSFQVTIQPRGSVKRPSLSWGTCAQCGLYQNTTANQVSMATNGTDALRWNEVQQSLHASGSTARPSISFISDSTTGFKFNSPNGVMVVGAALDRWLFNNAGTLVSQNSGAIQSDNGNAAGPGYAFTGSTNSGMYLIDNGSADTLAFATNGGKSLMVTGGTSPKLIGTSGLTLYARGASQDLTFSVSTSANNESAVARIRMGGTSNAQLASNFNGLSNAPFYTFTGDTSSGIWYRGNGAGSDTIKISTSGAESFGVRGGATPTWYGGAGNLTFLAGTGASRTMTLQSSNSSSAATSFLVGSGDTVKFSGHAIATGFTAAAGTPGSICYNTATSEITKNAATSCVVSSRRFKENIEPLSSSWAREAVLLLQPVQYNYKVGKTRAIGLIAEDVEKIDRRLVAYNDQKQPNSVNYEQITILLLAEVQAQRKTIDSLVTALRKKP